ncbi:MAG: hypothetical protein H6993_13035 [Pseudomonadales bacterium]|nr:hypothetical protein [Pseudomonadales bacterium]MCP5184884.1 hypothetical protein [Pseudomonadales bacterium]
MRLLRGALLSNRLPHALLLVIPDGWGKHTLLADITRLLLDLQTPPTDPLEAFAHPDFHWARSVDAKGETSIVLQVDAIRELTAFVTRRPSLAPRKVAVVAEAHHMNANAANALLKTLEEPAGDTCLVLETAQPGKLPVTVRSRCQRLPMRFSASAAEAWLRAEGHTDAVDQLRLAGGAPLNALKASTRGGENLAEVLGRLRGTRDRTNELERLARSTALADLLHQWYRQTLEDIVVPGTSQRREKLFLFADELLRVSRQVAEVKGANHRLLLDRLWLLWADAGRA